MKPTKCIIILGGGICDNNTLTRWSENRCDEALKYYYDLKHMYNIIFIVTSGGTYHLPNPIDKLGFTIFESTLMAQYLKDKGIEENNIYKEYTSYDTIGNAFFVKTIFTDIRDWKDLIVITSNFHMARSIEIFNFLFKKLDKRYSIQYASCKDNLSDNLVKDRVEKENKSKKQFKSDMKNITNIEEFHKWLFKYHNCYKVFSPHKKNIKKGLLYC